MRLQARDGMCITAVNMHLPSGEDETDEAVRVRCAQEILDAIEAQWAHNERGRSNDVGAAVAMR